MKQNMRLGVRKLLFVSVMIFAAFTLTAKDVFSADYIPAPVLVETSPKTITVTVNLTASPTEGLAPLNVTFTCTASAEVYYIETWAQPPQGSVDKEKEIIETHTADITSQPSDITLKKKGIYPFKATAEYEGVKGEDSVTVTVTNPSCADLFARKADLEKELADINKKLELLQKEKEELEAELEEKLDKLDENLQEEIKKIDNKIKKLEVRNLELSSKLLQISVFIEEFILRQRETETLLEELRADRIFTNITVALIESIVAYLSKGGATFSYSDTAAVDKAIEHLEESIKWYEKQINSLKDKRADYENSMIQIEHEIELYGAHEEGMINCHKTEVKQLKVQFKKKIQAKQKEINDFLSKITDIEKEIEAIEQQLKERGCVK